MRPSAADSALTTSMDLVENTGSTARDYCMLERNILTHIRLALLLSILSSSLLLDARLVPQTGNRKATSGTIPLASIEFAAAMTCIAAGLWEYYNGYRDLRIARAFMAVNFHLIAMSVVVGIVFGTCIVFVLHESQAA